MRATIEQVFELNDGLRSGRISREALQRLIENPDRYNDLGRFGRRFDIQVNYDLGIDRLVAENKFASPYCVGLNEEDQRALECLPKSHRGIRTVTVEFYEFDSPVTRAEAAAQIEADGYDNEDMPTLLTFGKEYPLEQCRRPIVALGAHWRGRADVWCTAFLKADDVSTRTLSWAPNGYRYNLTYRFLVSRK